MQVINATAYKSMDKRLPTGYTRKAINTRLWYEWHLSFYKKIYNQIICGKN